MEEPQEKLSTLITVWPTTRCWQEHGTCEASLDLSFCCWITSCILPCDNSIIHNLKGHYCCCVAQKIIAEIYASNTLLSANGLAKAITLIDAIHLMHQAWKWKWRTVNNCVQKAGFIPPSHDTVTGSKSDAKLRCYRYLWCVGPARCWWHFNLA